ncbi:AlpA family phage regulatory protein [Marinobacter nanhaiticus D15-8W]|uniref:AlpA family phage regulatory protein n=1 Tax=Marinobacter nanhaiticus D15-8W TaxID=626887 RepID=N6X7S2_9GAMM|nr:helix-turn-helix domain-containing protein [Marinobacter nanhaiticus]ENO17193.1 AlpA family phage regulatory protein [Marinobacter nanhaiticus D15-8W]
MFWTDVQVGNHYGVSRHTIWRWVREGKFPPPKKLSSGSTRWHVSDINRFDDQILQSDMHMIATK